ncbi:MAG: hypothetical protein GY758_27145 [Fuerstiella sp.]|nr:hypothetical protein [Fuerstiella sp.]MCP4511793.1 hypothetical protein [Fuerstiella sp.]
MPVSLFPVVDVGLDSNGASTDVPAVTRNRAPVAQNTGQSSYENSHPNFRVAVGGVEFTMDPFVVGSP